MDHLPNILRELKGIAPDPEFSKVSRMLILHAPKKISVAKEKESLAWAFWKIATSGTAISLCLLAVLSLGGILYMRSQSPLIAAQKSLKNFENEEFQIQIKLSELAAYEESAHKAQLVQRNKEQGISMNSAELQAEEEMISGELPINPDIDKALELML